MRTHLLTSMFRHKILLWCSICLVILAACAAATGRLWLPGLHSTPDVKLEKHSITTSNESESHDLAGDDHESHDSDGHVHVGETSSDHQHDEAVALSLSKQARDNIGVRLAKVELRPFERTITVPGMVVERPGWSTLEVTAPMTGVVTRIYPIQGQAVRPGQTLFEVRLTHEDLLQKQTDFLRTVEELDVINSEVARLEKVAADGAIAGKTLLERKYEQQKQEANLRVQHQALLLHGLSDEQIDNIRSTRMLLKSLTVTTPVHENGTDAQLQHKMFQVQEVRVSQGTYVTVGSMLCRLVDHSALYIEGKAFEQDVQAINDVAAKGLKITAFVGSKTESAADVISDLRILYLDDKVDPETRAFCFYVALPNHVIREDASPDGRQFLYWQFKPGMRMQIKAPVEVWPNRIVLPAEAVAQDGVDNYVFEANAEHFDRREVHIEYRDADWVVIANDGALKPGVMIAASAAHQMQLALKNKSGGAIDPHAGHNH